MKTFACFFMILSLFCFAPVLDAGVYSWTDENGVKHFSNTPPPDSTENVTATREVESENNTEEKPSAMEEERRVNRSNKRSGASKNNTNRKNAPNVISDPAVAGALNSFNAKMKEIGQKCKGRPRDCICSHLQEILEANMEKVDAFESLIQRRPELNGEMVKIDGVFGYWLLNRNDPGLKNGTDISFWERRYNCK